MYLLPAIDLRDGKCVRLLQGDYNKQIDYHTHEPAEQAGIFSQQGAQWLHVVDLDGALHGSMKNADVIEKIVTETALNVEVGGGIREESVVADLLAMGIARAIIGTRALEDRKWFQELVEKFPQKIVLGLDARAGKIATRAWTKDTDLTALDMARLVNDWPLAAIVYTDIACDGMLTGPNVEATAQLAESCSIPVIASGGVGTLDHIKQLNKLPIEGIIIGRALYEKTFTLPQALKLIT
ncbi:MAG: 1-(5-phosphoribosyl)-5-[(5-phosphoribosylamino)methylideneamino]imidazole-4-carboxamide isomerase [Sedimentisphaerales bacterium]|nr:1-(5-phosphoribosyl)-5-[(5-phosphoribosylamino)methylideneamino]imidazole-4-carboxamide isomerase [Sedimentisphaerales bacterium]